MSPLNPTPRIPGNSNGSRSAFPVLAIAVIAALFLPPQTAPAAVSLMGYWRFEDAALLADSGPNNLNLVSVGSGNGTASPLFGTNPVVQTGAVNTQAATFNGSGAYRTPDAPAFSITNNQFTVEAFVSINNANATRMIASQWQIGGSQRSWFLAVESGTSLLRFGSSSDGTNTAGNQINMSSNLQLQPNTPYYVGAAYDNGDVTFYLKDLSDPNSVLQSHTVSGYTSSLHDSTGQFMIGAYDQPANSGTGTLRWAGTIDEVRLSNQVLQPFQLLAMPEPSKAVLCLLGLLGLAARRRRA